MKTKIKRHSRAVLSIVLTLCMLMSCMTVGLIATDAAKTAEERVGAVDKSESVGSFAASGRVYFQPDGTWTNPPRLAIGNPWNSDSSKVWRQCFEPAGNIDGKIYYYDIAWTNVDGFGFIDVDWSCPSQQGQYWDWLNDSNITPKTAYIKSFTNNTLYIYSTDGGNPTSEAYSNKSVSAAAYVKTGSNFSLADDTIATASVSGTNMAGSSSSSAVAKYTSATFTTALVNSTDYRFVGWFDSSNTAIAGETNPSYTISSVEADTSVKAVYELKNLNASVSAKSTDDGSEYSNATVANTSLYINASGTTSYAVNNGSSANIYAPESFTSDGATYVFSTWEATGGNLGTATDHNTTFTPTIDGATAVAKYKKQFTITTSAGTGGTLELTSPTSANLLAGDSYTVTATPAANKLLSSLTLNGSAVATTNNAYTSTASGDTATLAFAATFGDSVTASVAKIGDGAGTATVNSNGTSVTVASGATVTYTATESDSNCAFYGWYSNSDGAPEHLYTTDETFTVSADSAVTYYAMFNYTKHHVMGYGAFVNWGESMDDLASVQSIAFTQSSSDSRIYTASADLKNENWLAVYCDGASPNSYPCSEDSGGSGTVAGAMANYTNDTGNNFNKWKVDLTSTGPKTVVLTWNAVAKTLSWTTQQIDPANYTVIYVPRTDKLNKRAYIWINTSDSDADDKSIFDKDWPGTDLDTFEQQTIDGTKYAVIYLRNDEAGVDGDFQVKVNAKDAGETAEDTDAVAVTLKAGRSYIVTRGSDKYDIAYFNLEARAISASVAKVDGLTVASVKVTAVNGVDVPAASQSANYTAYRGDKITLTYTYENSYTNADYVYRSTTGITVDSATPSTSSGTVTFTMPDKNVTPVLKFAETINAVYLRDNAGWGDVDSEQWIKIHVWKTGDSDQWTEWASDPEIKLHAYDTWEDMTIGNHTIQVMFDTTRKIYVFKGLDGYKVKFHGSSSGETADLNATNGYLYYTGGETATKISSYYDYTYTPGGDDTDWPPDDSTSITTTATYKLLFNQAGGSDSLGDSYDGRVAVSGTYKGTEGSTNCEWWFALPAAQIERLTSVDSKIFFALSSNGNSNGISGDSAKVDLTNAPMLKSGNTEEYDYSGTRKLGKASVKYAFTSDDKLGVRVVKTLVNGSNLYTYYLYTTGGSNEIKDAKLATISSTVNVYAKDGTIRRVNTSPKRNNITYSSFEQHANTFVCNDSNYNTHTTAVRKSTDGQSGDDWNTTMSSTFNTQTYDYAEGVEKGSTIYLRTDVDSTLNATHYLIGYCINGVVKDICGDTGFMPSGAPSSSGTAKYTYAYIIPKDMEEDYLEITPIYISRDNLDDTNRAKLIKFYVEGFDEKVQNVGWGNTLAVYPFYQEKADPNFQAQNVDNDFGGYPGQPMIFYKGNYYIMFHKEITANTKNNSTGATHSGRTCTIQGMTLSNNYWDDIHVMLGVVTAHYQTYDYDDLYKIYNERELYESEAPDKEVADNIICAFKYRNKKNNDEPSSLSSANYSSYTNGWELLTDYHGNPIDVFGNKLTDDARTNALKADPATYASGVRIISQDYKSNSAGNYATEWAIYNTDGTKVTGGGKNTIVPSALIINNSAGFSRYNSQTTAFQGIYDALAADSKVVGQPAFITYEKSIYGGNDKADRCDARWFYSKNGLEINASVIVEYSDDLGNTWTQDTDYSKANAYFTSDIAYDRTNETYSTRTISGTTTRTATGYVGKGYYGFNTAPVAGDYKFVGWYVRRDNDQQISKRSDFASNATEFPDKAEAAKNGDIFVARYVKSATGSFTINHEVLPGSTGKGNVYVKADVYNAEGTLQATYGKIEGVNKTSTITIPQSSELISSDPDHEGWYITATFKADPYGTSDFDTFYATLKEAMDDYNTPAYISGYDINDNEMQVTYSIDKFFGSSGGTTVQNVTSVTHYSKFDIKVLTYSLKFYFNTRYYGQKIYEYNNLVFTDKELESYFTEQLDDPAVTEISLTKQFVVSKAPFESNFMENLVWNVDNVRVHDTDSSLKNNYGELTATQTGITTVKAVFYDTDAYYANETAKDSGTVSSKLITENNALNPVTATYMQLFEDGTHTAKDEAAIEKTDTKIDIVRYIDHWDVYKLDSFEYVKGSDGNPTFDSNGNLIVNTTVSKLVAQSYSSKFNYVGYEDYAIVPVYSLTIVNRQDSSNSLKNANATLLSISRNHWNANVKGNTLGGSYLDGADRIYVDFVLSYNYDGVILNSGGQSNNYKVGFTVKSYTMSNGSKEYGNSKDYYVNNLDNKNRLEYCLGFNNTENNSAWGKYYEITPFVEKKVNGTFTKVNDLNPVILDGINFNSIGKSDTTWGS